MPFGQSVVTGLKEWTTISGRATRSEYWWFALFCILIIVPGLVAVTVVLGAVGGRRALLLALPFLALGLFLYLAALSATVRRLHDRNVSGLWLGILLALAFLHAAINGGTAGGFGLVLRLAGTVIGAALLGQALLRGSPGDNAYGPGPLARSAGPEPVGAGRARTQWQEAAGRKGVPR